ncbi:hypothetical protein PRIPAC_70453 [Pristionchus pacificus]|nr:hypothetical protein PRIPAC_70453 [Pristionchus pacificus]|eukprot:PDM74642.1 hypothetical protein PRIPAC_41998 [Pristionchus pacificus]
MSQTSSVGYWEIDQTDLFDKLDVAFTIILVFAGIITFPPACFVYYRILTLRSFQKQYLMKLFALNGFSVKFANLPGKSGRGSILQLAFNVRFLHLLEQYFTKSYSSFLTGLLNISDVADNILHFRKQTNVSQASVPSQQVQNDRKYFEISCACSVILSAIICFPLFFSNYTYYLFEVEDDVFAYIPYIPDQYKWSSQLAQVFHLLLSAATLVVDTIISIVIVQMRKEYSAKMKTRPEQGLLLSSVIALMMHIMNDLLLMSTSIFDNITLTYFITLTIAVSTTLPFWTMMTFAHTMRRTVFAGTWFVGVSSSAVGGNTATRTSSSANSQCNYEPRP